jgi:arylsulfatase A-like enzyme
LNFFNNVPDDVSTNLRHLDELGSPKSYNHYCNGLEWAFDTPFPYWRFAGYEGGTADMCLVSWPEGLPARGEMRHQYVHTVDLVPTLFAVLGIMPPDVLKGFTQSPIEGESFAPALRDPGAAEYDLQFYAMLGQRVLYHRSWLANTVHPPISGWSKFEHDAWELYHLDEDRAQVRNVADEHRDLLEELKGLWYYCAGVYHGLLLDDRSALEIMTSPRPQPSAPRHRFIYYPDTADVPEMVSVNIRRRSFTIVAGTVIDSPEAEGVLLAQ